MIVPDEPDPTAPSSKPPHPRTRWDDRYADGDWVDTRQTALILRDAEPWLERPGRALDLAAGAGRNALHLAHRGWRVLAVDLSMAGLRRIQDRLSREPGLSVLPVLADAGRFELKHSSVDLVVNTFFLLRPAFPLFRRVLRPGGLLVFETFSVLELDELGGDIRREFAVERGELLDAFSDFQILLHEEGIFEREEGERGLARLIARKPGPTHTKPL
jgi:tellurite methyltransferase